MGDNSVLTDQKYQEDLEVEKYQSTTEILESTIISSFNKYQ